MKTNKVILLLLAVVISAMASCSSDDAPNSTARKDKELAEWIKNCVLDENGEIYFFRNGTDESTYTLPAASAENAAWVVEEITRTKWDGNAKTLTLGEEGSVSICGTEKEGLYNKLVFNLKEIPAFTLEIVTSEYFDQNNEYGETEYMPLFGYFTICDKCREVTLGGVKQEEACPRCGWSRDIEGLDKYLKVGSLLCTSESGRAYLISLEAAGEKDFKQCVGVVFYAGHHPDDPTEYVNTGIRQKKCHGYALSLKITDKLKWMKGYWYAADRRNKTSWDGYTNTTHMIDLVNWSHYDDVPCARACRNLSGEGCTAPINSSGWFLPSIAQIDGIMKNKSIISESFSALERNQIMQPYSWDETFWSSTEVDTNCAYVWCGPDAEQDDLFLDSDGNYGQFFKNAELPAMPVLAF